MSTLHGSTPDSTHSAGASPPTLRFADYELDFARNELRRGSTLVALQPTPLRVLLYVAQHRDRTVPRRELLDAIWPGQWRLGKREEAVESLRRLLDAIGAHEQSQEIERVRVRGPGAVWRWLADQQQRREPWIVWVNLNDFLAARTFAELGEREPALSELERSVAEHEPGMELYGLDPVFDPIRDTPRFRALIEKMGLTAYHAKYLKRPRVVQPVAPEPAA